MAEYPALPLWTDAYEADCSHLSDAEDGCYLRLIIEMWRSRHCRIPVRNVPAEVAAMFDIEGGMFVPGWYSRRHVDWQAHPSRLLNSTWRRIREAFLGSQPRRCAYCGTTAAQAWEVDHIRPRALGGTHEWSNLAVACMPCNRRKGARHG